MPFLKNLRGSISRKPNGRDEVSLSRNSELIDVKRNSARSGSSASADDLQQSDGVVRSETFTINERDSIFARKQEKEEEEVRKSSMFGKFSTFTRKKKSNKQKNEEPKTKDENLSSSYKRYPTPSDVVVVSTRSDPFHYLYERNSPNGKEETNRKIIEKSSIDYGTYKKSKVPAHVLESLKDKEYNPEDSKIDEYNVQSKQKHRDSDKYKTVTINSFRKSFREKFLKDEKNAPYNPAWFVEVEVPKQTEREKRDSNNHQPNVLVFENEQYRPTARSPIRREYKSPTRSPIRQVVAINHIDRDLYTKKVSPEISPARRSRSHLQSPKRESRSPATSSNRSRNQSTSQSPNRPSILSNHHRPDQSPSPRRVATVKRNETFKVDRPSNEPPIRIEIRKSSTPNEPGRIVPVGVAKPIPSPVQNRPSRIIQRSLKDSGTYPIQDYKMYETRVQTLDPRDISRTAPPTNLLIPKPRRNPNMSPIISNYSPLKSFELLSSINRKQEINSSMRNREKFQPQRKKNHVIFQLDDKNEWPGDSMYSTQKRFSAFSIPEKLGVVIREVEKGTRCEECKNICAGYAPHEWRKTCQSCKCPREAHAIYQEQVTSVQERLGFKPENQTSRIDPRQLGYTWVPPGVMTSAKVQRYFDKIPQDKVPKLGTSGERYRERQITLQLPKQDLSLDHCKHLESQYRASYEDFVAARNEIALDIGYIKDAPQTTKCTNCDDRVTKGDLAVIAPKFREQLVWHPKCFTCATCDELLVDLTYCVHEDKIYCERHYAELLKPRCNACDEQVNKSSESKGMEKVSKDIYSVASELVSASISEASSAAEEALACDQQPSLRRSPRQTDMDQYESHLRDEESTSFLPVSPRTSTPVKSRSLSPSQLTQFTPSQITESDASAASQSLICAERNIHEKSSSPGLRNLTGTIQKDKNIRSKTPVIEIESVEFNNSDDLNPTAPGTLFEGISDFYDFNASVNPSRTPSRSPSLDRSCFSKSPSKHSGGSSFVEQCTAPSDPASSRATTGVSDFYDFCLMMNEVAYGDHRTERREGHRSTTDYLEDKLKNRRTRSKSPSIRVTLPKNGALSLRQEEGGGTVANPELITFQPVDIDVGSAINLTPLDTPSTPEYRRSFSETMRQVEGIRDDFRNNLFKRSTYVGESMDFENDFEELREQTRHFKRSRSKSRSPFSMDDSEPRTSSQAAAAARRDLQDKILEEITRTTINYQDFYRDVNQKFIDFERRGSDSALIQKPEIMIQIQDDDDLLDELEGEEYHHFRRFSLDQNYPAEEQYPESGDESANDENILEIEGARDDEVNVSVIDAENDSDRAEAEDADSESEDDRQTVVDVDDEIDEDVWDSDRPEESNDQSEGEEADREMDPYASKNAADWNEEGAVGGTEETGECDYKIIRKDSINIDQMYNDAVQNMEESGIEKDYDSIFEEMSDEEKNLRRNSKVSIETQSTKTEGLLEEILREDDEVKNKRWSPGSSHIGLTNGHPISSTRLRSRYGISPATPRVHFEDVDSINIDLNYIPKKEYKWRKNFKIDDDEFPNGVLNKQENGNEEIFLQESEKNAQNSEIIETREIGDSETDETEQNKLDEQYFGEKNCATIPEAFLETAEETTSANEKPNDDEEPHSFQVIQENEVDGKFSELSDTQKDKINENGIINYNVEETEKNSKRKKKKKSRKGSKGSLGENDALSTINCDDLIENESYSESGIKKKIKKKKLSADNGTSRKPQELSYFEDPDTTPATKRESSPPLNSELLTNSHSYHAKTLSPGKLTNASKTPSRSPSKSPELNAVRTFKDETPGARNRPQLERNDTFELIKDGSMYPLF